MKDQRLLTIFLITFTSILGFSLILPLIPYYGDTYNASDSLIGVLIASYAIAQLIGAPLLGRLSDSAGRRPTLMVSVAGTMVSLLVFGAADFLGRWLVDGGILPNANVNTVILVILFVSRITDGLTGGNIAVAQAYITDVTDEENRSRGLALIGVAFGVGFIFGPAAGGFLSRFGLAVPALVAASIAGISLLLVILRLPETLSEEERGQRRSAGRRANLERFRAVFGRPLLGPLIGTTFFFNMAYIMLQTVFTLYALRRFNLNELEAGIILTYVGVVAVIVQGGLIGPITKQVNEFTLIVGCTLGMALSLLGWGLAASIPALLAVLAGVSFFGGVMNVVLRTAVTKVVEREDFGGALGIQAATESSTRALSPLIGGVLIGQFGTSAPGIFGFVVLLLLTPYLYVRFITKKPQLPHKEAPAEAATDR